MARRTAVRPKPPRARAGSSPQSVLDFLTADHAEVEGMFRQYERDRRHARHLEKGKLALRICHALTIHAKIEQEIFYPAVAAVLAGEADDLLGKANVEHSGIEGLISKVEDTSADNPLFDSMIEVLAAYVARHVRAEEEQIFPWVRHSRLDLLGTGERLAARKLELSTARGGQQLVRRARKVMGRRKSSG